MQEPFLALKLRRSQLTAVTAFASSLTYHPNGLLHRIDRPGQVFDVQENDPHDMARPLRLRTTEASADFDTGDFEYDGTGNVMEMGSNRFRYDLLSRVVEAEVSTVSETCGEDLLFESHTFTTTTTEEVCGEIETRQDVTVASTGDVTFRAGDRIVLGDGFRVESGGRFAAEVDPDLLPGGGESEATWEGEYDLFGNLTSITTQRPGESAETRTPKADSATNRLAAVGTAYDLSGNVEARLDWEYSYDPFNMPWQAKRTGGNGFTFVYGPGDERLFTVDWTAGTASKDWVETWTLRDLDGRPLRQLRSEGGNTDTDGWSLLRDYVWRGGGLLGAFTRNGIRYFHLDHLGTPRLVTDTTGDTVGYHAYFPFGEEATSPIDSIVPLQYTGHERDDLDSGGTGADLDYMHARYFSANLGRFHSVDPVGISPNWPQSWNRYSYVLGNPIKYMDPHGLQPTVYDEITVTSTALTPRFFDSIVVSSALRSLGWIRGRPIGVGSAPQRRRISASQQCRSLIPQPVPPTVDLAQNIQEAEQHRWNLFWLANQVKTGAPWDFKSQGQSQFEAFGNFHYGVVFSAGGISPGISLIGAGAYQVRRGTSTFDWVFPYGAGGLLDPMNPFQKPFLHFPHGDDPVDAVNIMRGITFFDECVQ